MVVSFIYVQNLQALSLKPFTIPNEPKGVLASLSFISSTRHCTSLTRSLSYVIEICFITRNNSKDWVNLPILRPFLYLVPSLAS